MKKLMIIFSVFAIVYVLVSDYANSQLGITQTVETHVYEETVTNDTFVVKSENDKIVVYKGEMLYYKTNTSINTLPKKDRLRLIEGIKAENESELRTIIDEYCS